MKILSIIAALTMIHSHHLNKNENFNDEHAHPQTNYHPIRRIVMAPDDVTVRPGD